MKLFSLALVGHIVKQIDILSRYHGINIDLNKQERQGFIGFMILTVHRPIQVNRGTLSTDEDISVPWVEDFMA